MRKLFSKNVKEILTNTPSTDETFSQVNQALSLTWSGIFNFWHNAVKSGSSVSSNTRLPDKNRHVIGTDLQIKLIKHFFQWFVYNSAVLKKASINTLKSYLSLKKLQVEFKHVYLSQNLSNKNTTQWKMFLAWWITYSSEKQNSFVKLW